MREVGGVDEAAGPALEHGLALKVTERGGGVVHLPGCCSTARTRPPRRPRRTPPLARPRQPTWAASDTGPGGPGPVGGAHRLDRDLDPSVTVSIVMPTRWQCGEVWGERRCFPNEVVRTLLAATRHPAVEVVLVYDEPVPDGAPSSCGP